MSKDKRDGIDAAVRVARVDLRRALTNALALSRAALKIAANNPHVGPLADLTVPLDKQIEAADIALGNLGHALDLLEES